MAMSEQKFLQCMLIASLFSMLLVVAHGKKLSYLIDIGNPGAQYPIDFSKGAKNISDYQKGQLNPVGMRQQYLLGSYIREEYIDELHLLPQTYIPTTMQVFIGSYERASDSARARMYGLYPLGHGWKLPEGISPALLFPQYKTSMTFNLKRKDSEFGLREGFTPVIFTFLQKVLNNECANDETLKKVRLNQISSKIAQLEKNFKPLLRKLKKLFSLSTEEAKVQKINHLYHNILSNYSLGKQMPQGFDEKADLDTLKFIRDTYYTLLYDGDYGRIKSTLLLNEIHTKLSQLIKNPEQKMKYSAYFSTEPSIIPILVALNLTSPKCLTQRYKNAKVTTLNCVDPIFMSSNLLIELLRDDSFRYVVKVKYNGEYAYLCEKKDYECPFEEFWSRVTAVTNKSSHENDCTAK